MFNAKTRDRMTIFAENYTVMIRKAIKEAMEVRKVSQVELARELGISTPSMSYYLSGKRKISIEHVEKALDYLGLKIVLIDK